MRNRVLKIGNGKLDPESAGADPILVHCRDHKGTDPCASCHEALNMRGYYYAREAGGKVLATYETIPDGEGIPKTCMLPNHILNLVEWYIYGSESDGRIAVQRPYPNEFTDNLRIKVLHLYDQAEPYAMKDTIIEHMGQVIGSYRTDARRKGYKQYEIKDHLGNVRAVISDVKNPLSMYGSIDNWRFRAEIRNLSNYYPYGMQIPTGIYSRNADYNYGYNGMEKDDELKGSGKSMNFDARMYSTEGRFFSLDPLMTKYPMLSPYIFGNNNPIIYVDFDGREFRKGAGFKTEEDYNATLDAMESRNINVFNYANNLKYNPETREFVENPVIVEDPNDDKYINYVNVIFRLNIRDIDNVSYLTERDSDPMRTVGTSTKFSSKRDEKLNGYISYNMLNFITINEDKSKLSITKPNGTTLTIDLEDHTLGSVSKAALQISFAYVDFFNFSQFLPSSIENNEMIVDIYFDDFINASGNSETIKRGKVGNHEVGHFRFAFESVFNRIVSYIFFIIDKSKKGHNDGNPDGEAAKEAEKELEDE